MLSSRLLRQFIAVAEELNFGRAAERLSLSQSATSHALGRLRDLFGDPLFVRHPRGIEATPRARELAPAVAAALAQIRDVLRPVEAFDPAIWQRVFRVSSHDYGLAAVIAPLMAVLRAEAPGVSLRCVSLPPDQVIGALDRGDIDWAIGGFHGIAAERIARTELFSDRFVGVARRGHPKVRDGAMRSADFAVAPQVVVAAGAISADVARRVAMTTPNFLSVPLVVEASDLIGVLPERLALRLQALHAIDVFDLPVTVPPVSCNLLSPAPLAGGDEMRWLTDKMRQITG